MIHPMPLMNETGENVFVNVTKYVVDISRGQIIRYIKNLLQSSVYLNMYVLLSAHRQHRWHSQEFSCLSWSFVSICSLSVKNKTKHISFLNVFKNSKLRN